MTGNSDVKVGGLLLAAGGSTRFGSPKQLFEFQGKTLLRRAAEAIIGSGCSPIVVVLGANVDGSLDEISDLDVHPVVNSEWQTGMSSSIRAGLDELMNLEPDLDAVLFTLMDQPFITAGHLVQFVERFRNERPPIVASEYDNITGVPALFSRELFDELFKLGGEKGARGLIRNHEPLSTISLEEAAADVDNLSDLQNIRHI
jgi:molybdenum cofactor cytidylyltransferase